jgi:pimeloyl-ACP methyl ester carboxylesterase
VGIDAPAALGGGHWERHREELPWGRPDAEANWRLLEVPGDLAEWCADVRAVRVEDAMLRGLLFRGEGVADRAPVVFLPGWSSTPYSWRHALPVFAAHRPTWYLETREKSTSRLRRGDSLTLSGMAADLPAFIRELGAATRGYGVIAVSMGAVLLLRAFEQLDPPPAWVVLLAPHVEHPVPAAFELTRAIPRRLLGLVRAALLPLAYWNHRRRASTSLGGSYSILRSGDLAKLRRSLLSWRRDPGLDDATLSTVSCPCLVVGAEGDRLHSGDAARRIAESVPAGTYFDGHTFAWEHSPEMVTTVLDWAEGVTTAEATARPAA